MTQSPNNPLRSLADSSAEMLKLARQATARIVTAALEATAESADMERTALRRKFPALTSLPPALQVDPQQIRDFTRTAEFQDLIEQYIQGRVQGHLLARAFELLTQFLPALLSR